jgi:hypothetical protein
VQSLLQINGGTIWRAFETRRSLLVFIGQALEPDWIEDGLRRCEVMAAAEAASRAGMR